MIRAQAGGPPSALGSRHASRAVAAGALVVLALGGILALRPAEPDPAVLAAYRAGLAGRAGAADAALGRLLAALDAALQHGRHGAAATVSGEDPPSSEFEAAAATLDDARPPLEHALELLATLRGQLAIEGAHDAPRLLLSPDDLASIADQLRGTGPVADAFAKMRLATRRVLDELASALISLRDSRLDAAGRALQAADDALADVRAWPGRLTTLPIWITTAGGLLSALRDVADARASGDDRREASAMAAYEAAADDATRADRALAIALAEGGGSVSQIALARLADTVAKVEATRLQLAPLVHPS